MADFNVTHAAYHRRQLERFQREAVVRAEAVAVRCEMLLNEAGAARNCSAGDVSPQGVIGKSNGTSECRAQGVHRSEIHRGWICRISRTAMKQNDLRTSGAPQRFRASSTSARFAMPVERITGLPVLRHGAEGQVNQLKGGDFVSRKVKRLAKFNIARIINRGENEKIALLGAGNKRLMKIDRHSGLFIELVKVLRPPDGIDKRAGMIAPQGEGVGGVCLQLDSIHAGLGGEIHKKKRLDEIAVVIRTDLSRKKCRMPGADCPSSDGDLTHGAFLRRHGVSSRYT